MTIGRVMQRCMDRCV